MKNDSDKQEADPPEQKKKTTPKHTLCKLAKKKYLNKHLKEFQDLVLEPHYICANCGRVAKDKHYLCKPEKIH